MSWATRASDYLRYYLGGASFFAGSLLINALCLIGLTLPRRWRSRLPRRVRAGLGRLFRVWFRMLSAVGILRLKTPPATDPAGRIWIMNHPSIMDGAYLLAFVREGVFVYKRRIASNPFYGCVARLANYLPNRGGPDLIRDAVALLERGEDLIIFPEGTRSTCFDPARLKPGFALIAKRAKAPVHVLWCSSPPGFLKPGDQPWRAPRFPAAVEVRQLEVLQPETRENAHDFVRRVASIYARLEDGKAAS